MLNGRAKFYKSKLTNMRLFFIILFLNFNHVFSMKNDTTFVNGISYADGKLISIVIVNGKIVKLKPAKKLEKITFYVAPGLVDLQINGFMGVDFSGQKLTIDDIKKATTELWKVGVTTFLPTIITANQQNLVKSFTILSTIFDDKTLKKSIPGFHLEGPYISPIQGFRGVHLDKNIRKPNWEEFSAIQKASQNHIKLITLAPEIEGAIPFIQKCKESGVVVSLGHHNGSTENINAAVAVGATLSTHLGNGCANMINRHNNPLWPQLANDYLSATFIADGFHLNKEEIQCFYKMKGQAHSILVSDALDLAGMLPGEYIRDEKTVVLTPEVVKYPAENVLAGAASPIGVGVANMMKYTNCGLKNAIDMASINPSKAIGLKNIGEIKIGKRADLILFTIENERLIIQQTILNGQIVYTKNK
jgi:N-acetylglucosamine-6-phosphate deacetylase